MVLSLVELKHRATHTQAFSVGFQWLCCVLFVFASHHLVSLVHSFSASVLLTNFCFACYSKLHCFSSSCLTCSVLITAEPLHWPSQVTYTQVCTLYYRCVHLHFIASWHTLLPLAMLKLAIESEASQSISAPFLVCPFLVSLWSVYSMTGPNKWTAARVYGAT